MKAEHRPYNFKESFKRLHDIVNQSDVKYEEVDQLPLASRLTYDNGFYANCAAIFVDIQDSSDLPKHYKRPTLARLYRSFVSESIAVIQGNSYCRELSIVGDGVWGVFNTPTRDQIDLVFNTAAKLSSMMQVLNYELRKRNFKNVEVGIGLSWGRALMVKVGRFGTGVDDVVYMGDVVNEASHLADAGNQTPGDKTIMVSNDFYGNLSDDNKKLLSKHRSRDCWHGDVVDSVMEEWFHDNY